MQHTTLMMCNDSGDSSCDGGDGCVCGDGSQIFFFWFVESVTREADVKFSPMDQGNYREQHKNR